MYVEVALLLMCACLTSAVTLQCEEHTQCFNSTSRRTWFGISNFTVEGNEITMFVTDYKRIHFFGINCNGWAALDSPALPRFTTEFKVTTVELAFCPPPTRPIKVVLEALNVTIKQNAPSAIFLTNLPPEPALTELHFIGLESMQLLMIDYKYPTTDHVMEIIKKFHNIRTLKLGNVPLPVPELSFFKNTLQHLIIMNTIVKPLPEIMRELTYLKNLTLFHVDVEDVFLPKKNLATTVLPKMDLFTTVLPKPTLPTTTLPSLIPTTSFSTILTTSNVTPHSQIENIWFYQWRERRMIPFEHCESLRYLYMLRAWVKELPSGWIAACPRLEEIIVSRAENLTALPAGLLRGASALKVLNFTDGALESLPENLFKDASSIRIINLSQNRLRTISETSFQSPGPHYLSLTYNFVDNTVVNSLQNLTSLTELDLGYNPSINDLCIHNGTSGLATLTKLERLSLAAANISQICLDWRVSRTIIEVDLRSTGITNNTLIQFEAEMSNTTLNNATLLLGPAPYLRLFDLQQKQRKENHYRNLNLY